MRRASFQTAIYAAGLVVGLVQVGRNAPLALLLALFFAFNLAGEIARIVAARRSRAGDTSRNHIARQLLVARILVTGLLGVAGAAAVMVERQTRASYVIGALAVAVGLALAFSGSRLLRRTRRKVSEPGPALR